jgi:hypothetical protein
VADADDQLSFESTVLLARPEERMQLLQQRIREAIEAEKSDPSPAEVMYANIGFAALTADPALGLLIARGALPVCGIANQSALIEEMVMNGSASHCGSPNTERPSAKPPAGRLAAGDPSIWKTVRALRMRPGTLRARITGDYRLFFETGPAGTLHIIDLILRRDLDRWLAGGAR